MATEPAREDPGENHPHRVIKSNVLFIDGRDLGRSRIVEPHPDPSLTRGTGSTGAHVHPHIHTRTIRHEGVAIHTDGQLDIYSRYIRGLIRSLFTTWPPSADSQSSPTRPGAAGQAHARCLVDDTVWYQLKVAYGFQTDNLYNQLEDTILVLLSLSLQALPHDEGDADDEGGKVEDQDHLHRTPTTLDPELMTHAVREYHRRLFDNYTRWCDYMGTQPFPWNTVPSRRLDRKTVDPYDMEIGTAEEKEIGKMIYEIALFKMVWGEAANLRHTPEILCFIFHWAMQCWRGSPIVDDVTNWEVSTDQFGRDDVRLKTNVPFIETIRPVIQRIRDEAWRDVGKLRSPDHSARLLYDDFNEFFWHPDCLKELKRQLNLCAARKAFGFEPEVFSGVINAMAGGNETGKGIKSFVERRSYFTAIRAFWRVYSWHLTAFTLLLWFRRLYDDDDPKTLQASFAMTVVVTASCAVVKPLLDISLAGYRQMGHRTFWRWPVLRWLFASSVRFALLGFVIYCLGWRGGFQSDWLAPSVFAWGTVAVYSFYLLDGFWRFIHLRICHRMLFFSTVWRIPFLKWAVKPSLYTGNVPLLAENMGNIMGYAIFWIIALVAKFAFWMFLMLPDVLVADRYIPYIQPRKVGFGFGGAGGPLTFTLDPLNLFWSFSLWVPIVCLWLFDTQIFFLMGCAVASTLWGYARRVGYFKSIAMIQTRLMPLLDTVPIFNVPDRHQSPMLTEQPHEGAIQRFHSKLRQSNRSFDMSTPSRRQLTHGDKSSPVHYANNFDPYTRMVWHLRTVNAGIGSGHEVSDDLKQRKRFGFVWNEVVSSWREEDIISFDELRKLQYNEIPMIGDPRKRADGSGGAYWSDLRSPYCNVSWAQSIVRLPVYIYCDQISSFSRRCVAVQHQLDDGHFANLTRKKTLKSFYQTYLSPPSRSSSSPEATGGKSDPRFTSHALLYSALSELSEALFSYLSRYFEHGPQFTAAAHSFWLWVDQSGGAELVWVDLGKARVLCDVMGELLRVVEKVEVGNDKGKLAQLHHRLHQGLIDFLFPQSTAHLNDNEIPEQVEQCRDLLERCFDGGAAVNVPPNIDLPECDATELGGVAARMADLRYDSCVFGFFEEGLMTDVIADQGSRTAAVEAHSSMGRVAYLRSLWKLEAGASLEAHGMGPPSQLAGGGSGAVDGALRLLFRRALTILTVSEPHLQNPEGTRRLKFFTNSLLMRMPETPETIRMLCVSTLTPYYKEDVVSDLEDLHQPTAEGVSKMELLRSLYPVAFANFLQRVDSDGQLFAVHQRLHDRLSELLPPTSKGDSDARAKSSGGQTWRFESELFRNYAAGKRREAILDLCAALGSKKLLSRYVRFRKSMQDWASDRSQVLSRTVKGMMYNERGIQIMAYVDTAPYESLHLSHDAIRLSSAQFAQWTSPESQLWAPALACPPPYTFKASIKGLSKVKYHYVVSAQELGKDMKVKRPAIGSGEPTAERRSTLLRKYAILELMRKHPNLRVATLIDEVDQSTNQPTGYKCSVLLRGAPMTLNLTAGQEIPTTKVSSPLVTPSKDNDGTPLKKSPSTFKPSSPLPTPATAPPSSPIPPVSNPPQPSKSLMSEPKEYAELPLMSASSAQTPNRQKNRPDGSSVAAPNLRDSNLSFTSKLTKPMTAPPPRCDDRPLNVEPPFQADRPPPPSYGNDDPTGTEGYLQAPPLSQIQKPTDAVHLGGNSRGENNKPPLIDAGGRFSSGFGMTEAVGFDKKGKQFSNTETHNASPPSLGISDSDSPESPHAPNSPASPYSTDSQSVSAGTPVNMLVDPDGYRYHREAGSRISSPPGRFSSPRRRNRPSSPLPPHDVDSHRSSSQHRGISLHSAPPPPTEDSPNRAHSQFTPRANPFSIAVASISDAGSPECDVALDRSLTPLTAHDKLRPEDRGGAHQSGTAATGSRHLGWRDDDSDLELVDTFPFHSSFEPSEVESMRESEINLELAGLRRGLDKEGVMGGGGGGTLFEYCDANSTLWGMHSNTRAGGSLFGGHHTSETLYESGEGDSFSTSRGHVDAPGDFELRPRKRRISHTSDHGSVLGGGGGPPPQGGMLSTGIAEKVEEVFRVRLPRITDEAGRGWARYPIIGPGKPENQNHAVIFSRGEALQVIDMNMEGYLEECIKLRNLLQEFKANPRVRILGFREHIFTHGVSSISSFMALQELSFVTSQQRVYDSPLKCRMHYGHPDIFDRFFVQSCGGTSKASNGINLSEDVFAGFNCTARGFSVKQTDYIQVGKGRDVGLEQISMFEKKVASGNGEQLLSRDVCRMGEGMDFFRLMSLYHSGPGFFLNNVILMLLIYISLYSKAMAYIMKKVRDGAISSVGSDDSSFVILVVAPTTYIQVQLGFLLIIPLLAMLLLEQGLAMTLRRVLDILLKFGLFYYNFMVGLKASVVDSVMTFGGATYQETGRGFAIEHSSFVSLWRFYFVSHWQPSLELMYLLLICAWFTESFAVYALDTWPFWILVLSFLWTPFIFNPHGLMYDAVLRDFTEWTHWMKSRDMSGEDKSWHCWWRNEMLRRCAATTHNKIIMIIRYSRYLVLGYVLSTIVSTRHALGELMFLVYLFAIFGCVAAAAVLTSECKLADPVLNGIGVSFVALLLIFPIVLTIPFPGPFPLLPFSTLIYSALTLATLIVGIAEIGLVIFGRRGPTMGIFLSPIKLQHQLCGYLSFVPPVILAAFTVHFDRLQSRVMFNSAFVNVLRSGIVKSDILKNAPMASSS